MRRELPLFALRLIRNIELDQFNDGPDERSKSLSIQLEDKANIQVGDKTLVFSQTFLVPDNETAKITVPLGVTPLGPQDLSVHIRFIPSRGSGEASWRFEDKVLKIDFLGWASHIGTSFAKPVPIGDVNGKPLGFTVAHQKISDANNLVTLQFYTGGKYE
jgi:hypothetical protein